MEHRTKELTRAHGVHTALKVKDSKTGKVILKDNVFEDFKLECEINQAPETLAEETRKSAAMGERICHQRHEKTFSPAS